MRLRDYSIITIMCMAGAMWLTGCFTGVESTPRITDKEVKRQGVVATDEQRFLTDISPAAFSTWRPGKQWLVTGPKVKLVMMTDAPADHELTAGDTITLAASQQVPGITGTPTTVLTFADKSGNRYDYRVKANGDTLGTQRVTIPFTIDLDMVRRVDTAMRGRKLYIVSRMWLDSRGEPVTGRKFVPVTVTSVTGGNDMYPLTVHFVDSDGIEWGAYMSVGPDRASTRNFDTLFSFTDPYLRYPTIPADHWEMIVNGEIAEDMTREECRLSLGAPTNIDRRPTYGGVVEQWVYDDGRFLIFHDGLLRQFRK